MSSRKKNKDKQTVFGEIRPFTINYARRVLKKRINIQDTDIDQEVERITEKNDNEPDDFDAFFGNGVAEETTSLLPQVQALDDVTERIRQDRMVAEQWLKEIRGEHYDHELEFDLNDALPPYEIPQYTIFKGTPSSKSVVFGYVSFENKN